LDKQLKQMLSLASFSSSLVLLFRCLMCSCQISREAEVSLVAHIYEERKREPFCVALLNSKGV